MNFQFWYGKYFTKPIYKKTQEEKCTQICNMTLTGKLWRNKMQDKVKKEEYEVKKCF
jgi:hypothetical protein